MPDEGGPALPSPSLSRRRLAALIGGGALTGALWTTGLAVLARGRHPQLFVLGRERWQVVLLEHGTNRVILLLGEFDASPEAQIDLLCGLLRQHVDVVVGDGATLRLLSSSFRERRAVPMMIETGTLAAPPDSTHYRWLIQPMTIRAGRFSLTIEPLPAQEWRRGETGQRDWIAHATAGDVSIALAASLDTIARHGDPRSTLAVAPDGAAARLWRVAPGIAVATNSRESLDPLDVSGATGSRKVLIRTFRRDIAAFVIKDGRLTLPDWAEAPRA